MISNHRLHRAVGILLLCPLAAWSLTGLVFLVQPGYGAAYEALRVKTYALDKPIEIPADPEWQEVRLLRTTLGTHLLVETNGSTLHLNALTRQPFPTITEAQKRLLIVDAITDKAERYGELISLEDDVATTSSGIEIRLHWQTLALQQYGNDTRWIDRLYRLHYLQWTGISTLDKILGILGLILLSLVSISGFKMLKRRP